MTAVSRRGLLSAAARVGAGITVFAALPACAFNPLPALPTRGMPSPEQRVAWLRMMPDGRVRLLLPRQEIGQGVSIALRQIVAEELDIDIAQVEAVLPDTAAIAPVRATAGSDSLKDFAEPVARAAALLREHLRQMPASDAPAAEIVDRGQAVVLRSLTQQPSHRHVGTGMPTDRIRDIVTGTPLYAADIRLPDMLFGRILPTGAVMQQLSAGARSIALADGRTGIVAEHPAPIHAIDFAFADDPLPMPSLDIDAAQTRGRLEHRLHSDALSPDGVWDLDRRYDVPFAAHAQLEPRAAVAQWRQTAGPRLEVWTGTQDAFFVRDSLARHFGLSAAEVLVHSCRVGGGFGGRTIPLQELEAATLAHAAGRPVKVQWSRADEFRFGFHRPASSHRIRARLDAQGRIAEWWHGFCSGHVIFTSAAMPGWMQAVTSFVRDPGVARGALPPYAASRMRVEFSDIRLPVATGPWRGLGAGPNGFAIETAMDELAAVAGQDPLTFRLANLDPQHVRLRACLEKAAAMAEWNRPSAAGLGRGIACGIYKETSYAAVVAEVAVEADGAHVRRLYCAHDCGKVVNPDQVRAQIEGNLIWGIGMVLTEMLPMENGRVAAAGFADYIIPRLDMIPEIDIALIEPAGTPPSGAGETAMVAVAAISNAISAATGERVRSLPYRPQRSG